MTTHQRTTGHRQISAEDLAELCYQHLELGDDPQAWRKFWTELYRIGAHPNGDFLTEIGFDPDDPPLLFPSCEASDDGSDWDYDTWTQEGRIR